MAYNRYDPFNGNGINGEDPKKKKKQAKSSASRQEMSQDQYGSGDLDHWNRMESLGEITHDENQRLSSEYKDREHKKALTRSAKQELSAQVEIQNATRNNSSAVIGAVSKSKKANRDYAASFHKYKRDSTYTTNNYKRKRK